MRFHAGNEACAYAAKAKAVVVRHASDHQVIAIVEIVSWGNKSSQSRINAFVRKAVGDPLPEMPLFLTSEVYVPVSLEGTYQAAWQEFPSVWREVLAGPA